jgi:hypothetical protein
MGARLVTELRAGCSIEKAIASRRSELRDLLDRSDAVHALGHVILSETFMNPDTYSESEHRGVAYVIELVAAELLNRPSRAGTVDRSPAMDANFTEKVRELTQEATLLETFRRFDNAGGLESPESAAKGRAAGQHLTMRAPGWPWQEHAVLRGLFGPDHIASRLRSTLGFDAEHAITCSEAISRSVPGRLARHMGDARQREGEFGPRSEAYKWASASLEGWQEAPATEGFKASAMTALWAMNHVGEALVIDGDSLAADADVEPSVAAAFLRTFAISFGQSKDDWFVMAEQVRYRPFIDLGDDKYLLTVPGNDLWSMRLAFEAALKGSKPYNTHRARWLEESAVRLLKDALGPDETHLSLDFTYDQTDGATVAGEIDGLLRLGDTALLVEAKGATLRAGARRGGDALIKHLKDNITKAATQSEKAREALRRGDCLRKDGQGIQLGETIREVHPIVVTLDDLSSVAPVMWEFAGTRIMPAGVGIPLTVTLYELEHVCSTVEWPGQFVHFLRRRSRLNQRGGLVASDELDWWMHYLLKGLYFENETGPVRLTSHTDPLDAWVLYDRGIRRTYAPKPATKIDKNTRQALDLLHAERPGGWVAAACDVLDPASEAQRAMWKHVQQMRRTARERNKIQRVTAVFDEGPDPLMICNVVVPDADSLHVGEHLEKCVAERITEHGSRRVLGFGHVVSSRRAYDALAVVERSWQAHAD